MDAKNTLSNNTIAKLINLQAAIAEVLTGEVKEELYMFYIEHYYRKGNVSSWYNRWLIGNCSSLKVYINTFLDKQKDLTDEF